MRETVGSMRAYLILVAIVGGARSVLVLLNRSIFGPVNVPNPLEAQVGGGIDLAFALAFLFAGVFLQKLLRESPGVLIGLFCATIVVQIIVAIILLISVRQPAVLVAPGIALVISMYLLCNVKRLSADAQLPVKAPLTPVEEDGAAHRPPE